LEWVAPGSHKKNPRKRKKHTKCLGIDGRSSVNHRKWGKREPHVQDQVLRKERWMCKWRKKKEGAVRKQEAEKTGSLVEPRDNVQQCPLRNRIHTQCRQVIGLGIRGKEGPDREEGGETKRGESVFRAGVFQKDETVRSSTREGG